MLERDSAHEEEELGELEENPELKEAEDYRLMRRLLCDYAFPKGVLAANLAIHGMFWMSSCLAVLPKPRMWVCDFLTKHFVLSYVAVKSGRVHTLLASVFIHLSLWHLFINSVLFVSSSQRCLEFFNTQQVAALYLGGGLAGGLATVTSTHFQKVHHRKASVGGSAGVGALYVAFLCARDREEPFLFLPFDFLDTFIILIIVYEAIGAITSFRSRRSLWKSNVNHTAHLGGMATGALGYQCFAPGDPKHSSMHDRRK